jgi:hypothetical protein
LTPSGVAGVGAAADTAAAAPPDAPALKAARSTVASLAESAFLRRTTQMLPVAAEPCSGTSSLAISARRLAIRAGFGLRTMSELLRASIRIDGAASVVRAAGSSRQRRRALRRVAEALDQRRDVGRDRVAQRDHLDVAARGTSIAAMILPIRCRLSA